MRQTTNTPEAFKPTRNTKRAAVGLALVGLLAGSCSVDGSAKEPPDITQAEANEVANKAFENFVRTQDTNDGIFSVQFLSMAGVDPIRFLVDPADPKSEDYYTAVGDGCLGGTMYDIRPESGADSVFDTAEEVYTVLPLYGEAPQLHFSVVDGMLQPVDKATFDELQENNCRMARYPEPTE